MIGRGMGAEAGPRATAWDGAAEQWTLDSRLRGIASLPSADSKRAGRRVSQGTLSQVSAEVIDGALPFLLLAVL